MIATKSTRYASDDAKWKAVLRHDPRADAFFRFAVKTTGIYCRPSCRSRTPLRENVLFFPSNDQASRSGFRPCKRCQPDGPELSDREAHLVARACRILENTDTPAKLGELARTLGLSPSHFHRLFRKITGLPPKHYAIAHRNQGIRERLTRDGAITSAIYDGGYSSSSRFYEKSSAILGMKPRAYQRGGIGEILHFTTGRSSLGFVLVAESGKGICALTLGDDPKILALQLRERFPHAQILPADRALKKRLNHAIRLVENPKLENTLPLDIRGTLFQQKVWAALTRIPAGKTLTYTQVAEEIGSPRAIRAVAAACAANSVAVVIPCHRVVRSNGSLAGYRWGLERKRALLQREAPAASPDSR